MNEPSEINDPDAHRERARVVAVELGEKQSSTAQVWVEVFAKSSCGDCEASASCGQGVLSRWFTRKSRCYPVECSRGEAEFLAVGSWVDVEIPDGVLARVSLLVFVLPLLAMIAGATVFSSVNSHELSVAAGGALFFYLGVRAVRWLESSQWLGAPQPRLSQSSTS